MSLCSAVLHLEWRRNSHFLCSHRFYGDLAQHGVVSALIELCKDPDRAARKFACFAIGNAGKPGNRKNSWPALPFCSGFAFDAPKLCARRYCALPPLQPVLHTLHTLQASTTPACTPRCAPLCRRWCPCCTTTRTARVPMQLGRWATLCATAACCAGTSCRQGRWRCVFAGCSRCGALASMPYQMQLAAREAALSASPFPAHRVAPSACN